MKNDGATQIAFREHALNRCFWAGDFGSYHIYEIKPCTPEEGEGCEVLEYLKESKDHFNPDRSTPTTTSTTTTTETTVTEEPAVAGSVVVDEIADVADISSDIGGVDVSGVDVDGIDIGDASVEGLGDIDSVDVDGVDLSGIDAGAELNLESGEEAVPLDVDLDIDDLAP